MYLLTPTATLILRDSHTHSSFTGVDVSSIFFLITGTRENWLFQMFQIQLYGRLVKTVSPGRASWRLVRTSELATRLVLLQLTTVTEPVLVALWRTPVGTTT